MIELHEHDAQRILRTRNECWDIFQANPKPNHPIPRDAFIHAAVERRLLTVAVVGKVIGYMMLAPYSNTMHIIHVGVSPIMQRTGVGTYMFWRLWLWCLANPVHSITAACDIASPSNEWLEAMQFTCLPRTVGDDPAWYRTNHWRIGLNAGEQLDAIATRIASNVDCPHTITTGEIVSALEAGRIARSGTPGRKSTLLTPPMPGA